VQEDVGLTIHIAADEVASPTPERDVTAVGGDRDVVAIVITLRSARCQAHTFDSSALAITHEHVGMSVRVPRNEGGREAPERHVSAVDGNVGGIAGRVSLDAGSADARQLCDSALTIADEHVAEPVGIAQHEIRRIALEGDETALTRDRRGVAVAVRLVTRRADADTLRCTVKQIVSEDVGSARVSRNEIGGIAPEGHVTTVGADARPIAVEIALRAIRAEACSPGELGRGQSREARERDRVDR